MFFSVVRGRRAEGAFDDDDDGKTFNRRLDNLALSLDWYARACGRAEGITAVKSLRWHSTQPVLVILHGGAPARNPLFVNLNSAYIV